MDGPFFCGNPNCRKTELLAYDNAVPDLQGLSAEFWSGAESAADRRATDAD